nr:immunoglobulin light chain junction region [Macaca mulatta]MOV86119.1 immunoglobulin light chain junction region [Macaca mulatta]MOW41329.1 immunoglobulin light chain junction region [Macaca mulatta]MOW41485.1 immunoglobulin light chain junction region [Macaca mulatta]MOW41514.1 immunoglobulin light chain junction region [Macaca mulatta]
CQQDYTWPLTF